MSDLDALDITIFNADNIANPGLITFNLNNYDWYYMPQKIKTIGSNYVVWHCELDIYTTFIYRLYKTYLNTNFSLHTKRSQFITPGVFNEDPLIKNFNFNGKWIYDKTTAPSGKYTYSLGGSGVNPVVYAIVKTNTANNSSLTLIPILSKSNEVTITKPGNTSTQNLPQRRFCFFYDNGDNLAVNALQRNTEGCMYHFSGPSDPGVRTVTAKVANNNELNISTTTTLKFAELKDTGAGNGLDGSFCAGVNGVKGSTNFSLLKELIDTYNQAGATVRWGITCPYGQSNLNDYREPQYWPNQTSSCWAYWADFQTMSAAEFSKYYFVFEFERTYMASIIKYAARLNNIAIKKSDGTIIKNWSNPRDASGLGFSSQHYQANYAGGYINGPSDTQPGGNNTLITTSDPGTPIHAFVGVPVLQLSATTSTSDTTVTNTVQNSWSNINNLLLNNYSNLVEGLFLGPPVSCFEDNFVFENLADNKKYLTITLNKDGLPVRNFDFKQFDIAGQLSSYTDYFDFLNRLYGSGVRMPWWIEIYMPKYLYGNKFNFAKYLYNRKFTVKNDNDLTNAIDGLFNYNGTTNLILLNDYDLPKDCIYRISGKLPFYNDSFKQYINSTTNTVNTGYEIAKQNSALDIAGGFLSSLSQAASAVGSAMIGNVPGVIQGLSGATSGLMQMGAGGLKLQQQKNKIKAHYADQKNVRGATIVNSLMQDVLTLQEWYTLSPISFLGLKFQPTDNNIQALGELITVNGFLTEQDIKFTDNLNVDKSYIATAPMLLSEDGLNKLINDQKFKNVIPTPYYQNMVYNFLNRVITMKDMDS